MKVRAKMRCNSITKTGYGNGQHGVTVELGAVYSSDPRSENKDFAAATPTASLKMTIDPGRPASEAFDVNREYYVDITPVPKAERFYVKDMQPSADGTKAVLESFDKMMSVEAVWHKPQGNYGHWRVGETQYADMDRLVAQGLEYWRPVQ
jgi:hypothetical protein